MSSFLLMMSALSAYADEILIPHFYTKTEVPSSELSTLETQMVDGLRALGRSVVAPSTLAEEYPAFTNNCYTSQECVNRMLTREGARMIVVASVDHADSGYNIMLRYYQASDTSPIQVMPGSGLSGDQLTDFWTTASEEANILFTMLPTITKQEEKPKDPQVIYINKGEENKPLAPKTLKDDPRLKSLPKKLQDDYLNYPGPVSEWMKNNYIRAGNVLVEIHFGVSFGDVFRRYDTRIGLTPQLTRFSVYEYDSWITGGPGVIMGGSIGYAPTWWLETSIYGGVVLYQKELTTGWEMHDGSETNTLIDSNVVNHDSATSAAGQIEPRIRLYMVPSGSVKPYILGSAFIRIFDGYNPPSLKSVEYSLMPGGVHVGATGGLGLAFDSTSPVGVFVEIPYTYLLNTTVEERYEFNNNPEVNALETIPDPPSFTNQIIAFKVGMNLRFQ